MPSPDDRDREETDAFVPEEAPVAPEEEEQEALAEAAEVLADEEELEAMVEEQSLVPAGAHLPTAEELEGSTLNFIKSFNRQLDQIQEMKDRLETEAIELKKEIAARERTIAEERRHTAELEQELERTRGLDEECKRLQDAVEDRDRELETARAEFHAREAAIKQKDSLIAELNANHEAVVEKNIEMKEEIRVLKEERPRLEAELEALKNEKEAILNEKRRVEQAMNQLDAKYQAARDELMSAKKILGELQSAFETSQRKARAILDRNIRGTGGSSGR